MVLGIMTCATMGEAIYGKDALDGGNGRQWPDFLLLQDVGDGLSSIREAPVIEMEPFHYNDFFDFLKGIEAHRFIMIMYHRVYCRRWSY